MAVKIRLQRKGKKKSPFYAIVATDERSPRNGKFLEYLGNYNPISEKKERKQVHLYKDRILYWISVGAQPSHTVARLLSYASIYPRCPVPHRSSKNKG